MLGRSFLSKDLLAGLLFVLIGGLFLYDATNYSYGTVRRMGPGWFPVAVSCLLIAVGAIIAAKSFIGERHHLPRFSWGILANILIALIAFASLLRPAGVSSAVFALVMVSSFAYRPVKIPQMIAVALGLGVFCALVFKQFLGLPITIFGTYVGW
jgi:hypothetical protein